MIFMIYLEYLTRIFRMRKKIIQNEYKINMHIQYMFQLCFKYNLFLLREALYERKMNTSFAHKKKSTKKNSFPIMNICKNSKKPRK
uniref:Uncharacterized protein n=1 Tax=Ixodes ricinus TaxID=34613 RepID=A0A6B0U8Y6_IXORI